MRTDRYILIKLILKPLIALATNTLQEKVFSRAIFIQMADKWRVELTGASQWLSISQLA